jgi:hypothetical protein
MVRCTHSRSAHADAELKTCRAVERVNQCPGGAFCVHDCYETLSEAAMRAEVEYCGVSRAAPQHWRSRLICAIENNAHPYLLRDCGVTAALLAYCGITLEFLVERRAPIGLGVVAVTLADTVRYPLEHLIDAFELSFADLCLLGFRLPMLRRARAYPMIVLYDRCEVRADALFSFEIGFADLQQCVLDVDKRYATLLQLNLPWWQSALAPPPVAVH